MKVLLVEDYATLSKSISKAVKELGWAVDAALDGEDGLWFARNQPYDVIILDLMLPKLSGLEILRTLRYEHCDTPILILTARDSVEDRIKGLDMGADDYLVKPFFIGELLSRLRALARRKYDQKDPVIRLGPLQIHTSHKTVQLDDRPVDLTAREYALLEYMARRKGHVVSRTEIWDHVYEYNGGSGSNVVDVYIGYLRRKLRTADGCEMIRTRRGHGYILDTPTRESA